MTKENYTRSLYNEMYTLFSVQHTKITIQEKRILLDIIAKRDGREKQKQCDDDVSCKNIFF